MKGDDPRDTAFADLGQRFQLALNAADVGVWDFSPTEQRGFWSDTLCDLFGLPRTAALVDATAWAQRVHPDDLDRAVADVSAALSSGDLYRSEYRIVRPAGDVRTVRSVGTVYRSADGAALRAVGVTCDISASLIAADANRERDQAAQANQAKTELLARVSHDLRTPLNAIRGFLQLIELSAKHGQLPDAVHLDGIRQASDAMLRLANDLLDHTRIETGSLSLDLNDVPLVEVVERATAMARAGTEANRFVHVEIVRPFSRRWAVVADRGRLEQIIANLVSNAIKYNRPDGRVSLWARVQEHSVELVVADTGIGLAPGEIEQLFQPFRRIGHGARKAEGFGLGLAISKALAEKMGGSIAVDSRLDEGSRFTLRLRRAADVPLGATAPDASGTARRVLLYIEDNRANAELMQQVLAVCRVDHQLVLAATAAAADEVLRTRHVDCLLVDMNLPGESGIDYMRRLQREGRALPWIAVTANVTADALQAARAAGCMEVWRKPLDVVHIVGRLAAMASAVSLAERRSDGLEPSESA